MRFHQGYPPAIAIEQKVSSRNPRSTVGTSTEIYEYLRLLYARVGRTFSPVSGQEVKKHSTEDIVNCMLRQPEGTRYTVLTPDIAPRRTYLAAATGNRLEARVQPVGSERRNGAH